MKEITHGEALDLHLKGEQAWVMVPFDDTFHIATLKKCRCFKDEAVVLKEHTEELIGEPDEEPKPKEAPKRAPKGSRKVPTSENPKKPADKGKILALAKCNLKNKGSWPAKKIADDVGCLVQTVYNEIAKAKKAGLLKPAGEGDAENGRRDG